MNLRHAAAVHCLLLIDELGFHFTYFQLSWTVGSKNMDQCPRQAERVCKQFKDSHQLNYC